MVVRLTHRAAPAQQHYTIPALTGSFSLTGVSTMFRTARKMDVPDKIPYLLTGQPVALSKKPPVWSATPSYSITAGVASGPTAIPVSVPGGGSPIITVTWSATGTPSTKPSWVTLNSGASPTIQFTGAQTDGDDISGMVLSAVANGQPAVLSQPGTIVVNSSSAGSWRSLTLSSNISPFEGSLEHGFGGHKHIALTWHPLQERVFNGGGDYGYGADYTYTQGVVTNNMGTSTWTTFAPTGARSHSTPFGLRGDHYSLNPLSTSTWRFEHPHMPTNVGGSPENRPTYMDMIGFPWDPVEQGFWVMEHTIRDDQTPEDSPKYTNASGFYNAAGGYPGGDMDEWANSNVFEATGTGTKWEITGTYLWTPNPSIGPNLRGTYTRKFDDYAWGSYGQSGQNTPVYFPSGSGEVLRVNGGGAGHGYLCKWAYYATTDQFVGVFGGGDTRLVMLIFSPRALPASGKRYEYRMLSTTGWQHQIAQACYCDILNDYLYTPVETGSNAGVRKSSIHWLHLPTALAAAQGATLSMGTAWGFVDSPFTFRPDAQWENTGTSDAGASNVGLVVVNEKVVVCGGYYDLVSGSVTRVAYSSDPRAGSWTFVDSFPGNPGNLCARSWCAIPTTGEVMFLPASLGGTTQSPANVIWFCSIPAAQTPLEQFASTMAAGTWSPFTTNNLAGKMMPVVMPDGVDGEYNTYGTILEYTDKFVYDENNKKFWFAGCSRGGTHPLQQGRAYDCAGDGLQGGHISYNEVTNTWAREPMYPVGMNTHQHAEGQNCFANGYYFYFEGGGNPKEMWRRDVNNNWTSFPMPPSGAGGVSQAAAIDFFPEINCLVLIDGANFANSWTNPAYQPRLSFFNLTTNTWGAPGPILLNHPVGEIQNIIRYSKQHGCMYFGGGSGQAWMIGGSAAHTLLRLTADGVVTRMPDSPAAVQLVEAGSTGRSICDPVSGNLLAFSSKNDEIAAGDAGATAGRVYSFNGVVWTQHGTHPINAGNGNTIAMFCAQPNAGVIMAVNYTYGGTSSVYLYKHNGTQALTGLDWNGTGSVRRMLYFSGSAMMPAHPATYLHKVYQRQIPSGIGDQTKYFTTFFHGPNGVFTGGANYYGAHPYPQPDNTSTASKMEISARSNDWMGRGTGPTDYQNTAGAPNVTYNTWYNQAFIAANDLRTYRFYTALPSVAASSQIYYPAPDSYSAPGNPCICYGQAPDDGFGQSWGHYSRWEEQNAIIRGIQQYSTVLTEAQIVALSALETDTQVLDYCAANGLTASLWYLNMNPQPTDVADRSGNGHHPQWAGSGRPTLWTE